MTETALHTIGWIAMSIGAVGALFNVNKKRIGFLFYITANILMVVVGSIKTEWYNVAFFTFMTGIAWYGYRSWKT